MGTSDKKSFDLTVHHFDPKSKRISNVTPYTRHVHREKGTIYERGGQFFYLNGDTVPPGANWVAQQAPAAHSAPATSPEASWEDTKTTDKSAEAKTAARTVRPGTSKVDETIKSAGA